MIKISRPSPSFWILYFYTLYTLLKNTVKGDRNLLGGKSRAQIPKEDVSLRFYRRLAGTDGDGRGWRGQPLRSNACLLRARWLPLRARGCAPVGRHASGGAMNLDKEDGPRYGTRSSAQGSRAAARPPTPPGSKESNGNGSSRVSGSRKARNATAFRAFSFLSAVCIFRETLI